MTDATTNKHPVQIGNPLGWIASRLKGWMTPRDADQSTAEAIKELKGLEDYQLADIGLTRSELTAEGLATAGARRARKQDEIARDMVRYRGAA